MGPGRTPSKHWVVDLVPVTVDGHTDFIRVKKLTPAGMRRRKRRHAILEAVHTLLFVGDDLREAFQEAARTIGARPDDKRWAWAQLQKLQREAEENE